MRQDQFERLGALSEKLTELALEEADPENWAGHGLKPNEMTRDTRGDRYWCKRSAAATVALLTKVHSLVGLIRRASSEGGGGEEGAVTDDHDELEEEIARTEKEAVAVLDRVQKSANRKEFMKKTLNNGKA